MHCDMGTYAPSEHETWIPLPLVMRPGYPPPPPDMRPGYPPLDMRPGYPPASDI